MEKNEIKKALYKQKPIAKLLVVNDVIVRKGIVTYNSFLEDGSEIIFEVKVNDMGDAPLLMAMDAKLLIRYLV